MDKEVDFRVVLRRNILGGGDALGKICFIHLMKKLQEKYPNRIKDYGSNFRRSKSPSDSILKMDEDEELEKKVEVKIATLTNNSMAESESIALRWQWKKIKTQAEDDLIFLFGWCEQNYSTDRENGDEIRRKLRKHFDENYAPLDTEIDWNCELYSTDILKQMMVFVLRTSPTASLTYTFFRNKNAKKKAKTNGKRSTLNDKGCHAEDLEKVLELIDKALRD